MRARPVVRLALDLIDEVLQRCDQDSKDLWAVLTALRGPDMPYGAEADELKLRTTATVRAAAFPRTRLAQRQAGTNLNPEPDSGMIEGGPFRDRWTEGRWQQHIGPKFRAYPAMRDAVPELQPATSRDHFMTHYNSAVDALMGSEESE